MDEMRDGLIIGMGYGAEQSHYTRKPFYPIKLKTVTETGQRLCQQCHATPVFGKQKYCKTCAAKRAKQQRKEYARRR
jgi:uncharacterized paraquat-inducible protein A